MSVSATLLLLQKSCDVGEIVERSVKKGEEVGSWENREKE